ncbi:hypothetical protein [Ottowia sp.]|uniref:hypothetical protein n=1 Tax=Ottowia sp. TaxID=1898956 RepID=UPI0025D58274|nr:hypothetical protein [Ottowia sp.]MBK6616030.1 hypothetical protein [Ottowia sp.]
MLLSLFFPLRRCCARVASTPAACGCPAWTFVVLCAVIAVLPAMLLARDGQLRDRIPRWNVWIALVPVFCVLFLLLHVGWTKEFAATWLRRIGISNGLVCEKPGKPDSALGGQPMPAWMAWNWRLGRCLVWIRPALTARLALVGP